MMMIVVIISIDAILDSGYPPGKPDLLVPRPKRPSANVQTNQS